MILALSLLTLLVATNTCSAAIKGGPRIIQEPAVIQDVSQPHIHLSKGGGGGALHHTAVVNDPVSGPVVVEKVSRVGGGGIKTAGLGADSAQLAISDGPFGRRLYRVGPAQYPYGLTGLDYYSYPNSLLTAPRGLRRKSVLSNNLSGLRPVGFGSGLKGGVIADPLTSQFSIGDAQIKTSAFGPRRNIYRTGLSPVPFGLMGLDYYSYPKNLLLQRSIDDGFGLRQTRILGGGSAFTAGDSQIRGPVVSDIGQGQVTVVETDPLGGTQRVTTVQKASPLAQQVIPQQVSVLDDGLGEEFGQRKVTTTTITESADPVAAAFGGRQVTQTTVTKSDGLGGLRGGQIILSGGPRIGGLRRVKSRPVIRPEPAVVIQETSGLAPAIGGFGQRQVTVTKAAPAPFVQAPVIAAAPRIVQAPVRVAQAPIFQAPVAPIRVAAAPVVQAPFVQAPVIARAPTRIVQAPAPVQFVQAPAPVQFVQAPAPVQIAQAPIQRVITRRPGEVFLSQVARPQYTTIARPAPVAVLGGGNVQFTLGGSQLIGGGPVVSQGPVFAAPRPVVVAQRPAILSQRPAILSQRPVVVAQRPAVIAQRPAVIAQRPAVIAQRPVVVAQSPVVSQVKTAPGVGRSIFGRRIPQMVYVDGGSRFPGIDIIGGSRIGDPRFGYTQLPISTSRFASLGSLSQQVIPVSALRKSAPLLSVSSPVAKTVSRVASPLGLSPVGKTSPSKVVTQEEVIGPAGDSQIVTTVTETGSNNLVSSKIGGLAVGGLSGIGQAPSKVVTQEEVVGPAGDRQILTTVTETDSNRLVGSKIGGPVISGPTGFAGIGGAPTKTITQEEVVGPLGDSQIVTTVTKTEQAPAVVGPSKIGGLAVGGLAGVGHTPSQVVTQEEVVGPAGDRQILTTVTETDSNRLVGSKIGGPVISGPSGFAGIGGSPTQTITQEEVVGPLGDSQIVTTVTKTEQAPVVVGPSKIGGLAAGGPLGVTAIAQSAPTIVQQEEVLNPITGLRTTSQLTQEITQDPIETAISQAKLGSSIISSPFGSGQSHVSLDDILDPSTVVKETTFSEPGTGTVTKVTEVSQSQVGDSIVQQNIADSVVQESISPGFGGGLRFSPRVTFLSQHPYDVPDGGILRSILSRPVVQQQQELEQILVK